jgi:phage FluMu protein Com
MDTEKAITLVKMVKQEAYLILKCIHCEEVIQLTPEESLAVQTPRRLGYSRGDLIEKPCPCGCSTGILIPQG